MCCQLHLFRLFHEQKVTKIPDFVAVLMPEIKSKMNFTT